MLADSPYRHELEADIEPFRSILLGLFFVAVGMMLDIDTIVSRPAFVIGMAVALIAVKAAVLFGLARLFGMENRRAVKLGLLDRKIGVEGKSVSGRVDLGGRRIL